MPAWESRGQTLAWEGLKMIPPPLAVRPELTADDVAWLNEHLALTERPPVQYARELPKPPPPPGGAAGADQDRTSRILAGKCWPDAKVG